HKAIMELAGNDFVTAQLPLVHMTSQVFVPIGRVSQERAVRAIDEHGSIARAIREGSGEEAEQFARAHIRQTVESLLAESEGSAGEQSDETQTSPKRGKASARSITRK